jgi:hypothetical protein
MASTEEDDDARARRHAVWGLSVLVLLAVLVISVTLFFTGTSGGKHGEHIDLGIPTPPPTATQPASPTTSAPATAAARSSTPPSRQPTSHAARRTATASVPATQTAPVHSPSPSRPAANTHVPAAPCSGAAPCAVAGDGGIAAALDAARQARGSAPVHASVSALAQECAASGGAQCTGQYAVQTATAQSGRQAVAALAASPDNAWLFAPATAALQVGWAYLPDLREYVVALLAQ